MPAVRYRVPSNWESRRRKTCSRRAQAQSWPDFWPPISPPEGRRTVLRTAMKASAVLTRPQGKNETLVQRLAQAGLDALALPALLIKPVALRAQELPLPELYDLIVFVSGNAARFYIDTLDVAVDQNRLAPGPAPRGWRR